MLANTQNNPLKAKDNLDMIKLYVPGKAHIDGQSEIIKLSSNENPYGPAETAKQAFTKASETLHHYPDGSAFELRKQIAHIYNLDPDRIVCGAGSDNLIELLCLAFAGTGDEVIFSTYSFPVYRTAALIAGAKTVEIPYCSDYQHDIDAMINAISPKTKLIFLASPDNPTGQFVTKDALERLVVATPSDCLLVIDEAYGEYVLDARHLSGIEFAKNYPNVVVTRTFSKLHALAALRVGWGYMPQIAAEALNKIRSPFNVSHPGQMAAIASLKNDVWIREQIELNHQERQRMSDYYRFANVKFIPSQANFICLIRDDAVQLDAFLKQKGIIVRMMAGNGTPELLRISIGTHTQNTALQAALTAYLS